jgi:hypothetical protein
MTFLKLNNIQDMLKFYTKKMHAKSQFLEFNE